MGGIVSEDFREGLYGSKDKLNADILYELRVQYRYLRKKLYKKNKSNEKKLTEILYITPNKLPKEYILSFQKQYPDKIIKVLMPCTKPALNSKKIFKIKYNVQNTDFYAYLYKNAQTEDNIQVYNIYSEIFEEIESFSDMTNIANLIHLVKTIRIAAKKLNPEIIHCENIPFFLGMEFEKKKYFPPKIIQTVHNTKMYSEAEPFWAVINILDRQGLKQLCKDKIIRKKLGALFGVKTKYKDSKTDSFLDYLYRNFDDYRAKYTKNSDTNENILLDKLDNRVKELFPNAFKSEYPSYSPLYYSAKCSGIFGINSISAKEPAWLKDMSGKVRVLKRGFTKSDKDKTASPFNKTDFRERRNLNKQYLLQEFSEKTLDAQFTDDKLYIGDEITVLGYLSPNYSGILLFTMFDEKTSEEYIKMTALAILNSFEQRKNIQIIFNVPQGFTSPYFDTYKGFLETQSSLNGRWIITEGELNLAQFLSASDMILLTDSTMNEIENILFSALKYGCIPVVTQEGIFKEVVAEIFDDMTRGCGFIKPDGNNSTDNCYSDVLLKAINFYNRNSSNWNSLIKNAINYDSSWDFEIISRYNDIYEEL